MKRNTRMLVSIVTALAVFAALNGFIGWNGAVFWSTILPGVSSGWFWLGYCILAFSYLFSALMRGRLPYRLNKMMRIVGSYGMAVLFYGLILLPIADLAVLALRLTGSDSRTAVLWTGWITLAALGLVLALGTRNAWNTVVRRYDIRIPKPAGDGRKELRIAAASDIHLGTMVGNVHLRRLVDRMKGLHPDLILLPGDILDDSVEPFIRENMADVMQQLHAPLGVYASLGNHEYIGGHVEEYVGRMKKIGIEVLRDQVVNISGSFYVAGRKDKAAEQFTSDGRLPVRELLARAETDLSKPVILLDHQPHALGTAAEAGVDLMLSGHTHRGQMAPAHLVTKRLFELDWGYIKKGAMHVIVSSGFGLWGPPVRLGSRSEIIDIRVTFG